jgi:hypothetical protein
MRPWIWPAALSVLVVVACGAWEADVQSQITGPERSVDFRPLVPLVLGAAALAAIWLLAALVWVIRLWRQSPNVDPDGAPLVDRQGS